MFSVCANAAQLYGKVIAVSDGDTLILLDEARLQHKVRLAGIDAPEQRQPYGERAKRHLSALAHGKQVLVVWHKRDRYRRIVGRVLAADCPRADCGYSVDVGLEQIRAGLAWHYKQYQGEQAPEDRARYAALEQQARTRREGLWTEPAPVPPWDFRHAARLQPRATSSSQWRSSPGRGNPGNLRVFVRHGENLGFSLFVYRRAERSEVARDFWRNAVASGAESGLLK